MKSFFSISSSRPLVPENMPSVYGNSQSIFSEKNPMSMDRYMTCTPRFFLLLPRCKPPKNRPNLKQRSQRSIRKGVHHSSANDTTAPEVALAQSQLSAALEWPGRFRNWYAGFAARVSPASPATDAFGGPGRFGGSVAHATLSGLQPAGGPSARPL